MAREKFQTLTEQMFYVLLTLREECCGTDVMARISNLTQGRVTVGPGTLYNLLDSFQAAGWIMETKTEGRRRSYLITPAGEQALAEEYQRLQILSGGLPQLHGPERRDRIMKLFDRQKKWEINLYSYYDHAGIVRHLEDMARQGWQLEKAGSVFWTYRRCKPTELRYAVVYFSKASQFEPGAAGGASGSSGSCAKPPAGSW